MNTFMNAPAAVYYFDSPDSKACRTLQDRGVKTLFLDSSNVLRTEHFTLFEPVMYYSAGTYEPGRKLAANYNKADIGLKMDGWEEYWLDIRSERVLTTVKTNIAAIVRQIEKRFPSWEPRIDLDNLDAYENDANDTGFPITKEDQVRYINELIKWFNQYYGGVSIRNSSDIVSRVNPQAFLVEQAVEQKFLSKYDKVPFSTPVYTIEYYKLALTAALGKSKCAKAAGSRYHVIGADKNLKTNYFNI